MESVLFANDSGPLTNADVSWPVPLPVSKPPSVVEPVPPKLTASVVEPTTLPFASVVRMEEVIDGKYSLPKIVRLVVDAFTKYAVVDDMKPFWNHSGVVVALTVTP